MGNGIFALAPNRMGHAFANRGVDHLTANWGHGVDLLKPKPLVEEKEDKTKTMLNSLRVSKAREFGKKKTEVGF